MSANNHGMIPARNWGYGDEYGDSSSSDQSRRTSVPWPIYYRSEEQGGMFAPWRLFEQRVRTGPYGLTRFPSSPHSPVRILILQGGDMNSSPSPGLRQFIQDSPPRIRGEWHLPLALEPPEPPGLTNEELKRAMKKLKQQVYTPPYSRKRSWKRGLFSNGTTTPREGEEEEQDKNCPVCLEKFVANEQVLVTPCNHMFHHDCLVPWVKSSGHCPVCRLVFYKRSRSNNGHNQSRDLGDEELSVELLSLVRAMEEAFNWLFLSPR